MKKILSTGLLTLGLISALTAAPTSFDFKDPKGVNNVQFKLDAVLEPISGSANGIIGTVSFDPAAPEATTGKIVVATDTLAVSNKMMTGHLLSDKWLDAPKNPEITFELGKLSNLKTTPDSKTKGTTTTATATGKFTVKGVTKEISVPVKLTYLPDALEGRTKVGNKGDLLVVRSEFTILRADYGINPGQMEDKVSPEIMINVAVVGTAPKS
jgi:polyisoprenoid-binding protein YceI